MTGKDLIKKFEGKYLKAYLCPAGVPTIGYGHTTGVKMGDEISDECAERLLLQDYMQAEQTVLKLVKVPLTSNQLGALASFVFNLGEGNFAKSTLLKKLNASDFIGAANEFDKWVFAAGIKLKGLIARRAAERKLFETL